MQKITSVGHALQVLGQTVDFDKMRELMPHLGFPDGDVEPIIADLQIKKIVEANNVLNNWKRVYGENWGYSVCKEVTDDSSKASGFGFSRSHAHGWLTGTCVGARLEVGTRAEALYIGKDFEHLFEIAWLIIPAPEVEPPSEKTE